MEADSFIHSIYVMIILIEIIALIITKSIFLMVMVIILIYMPIILEISYQPDSYVSISDSELDDISLDLYV